MRELKPITKELGYSIDGYLKSNLDAYEERRRKKFDLVFLIDGEVGAGKTTIGIQALNYLDRSFNLDRIYFTPEQFHKGITTAKPDTAHLLDEAYLSFNSKSVQERMHRTLVAMMTMIRSKRLIIGIVAPSFFDLDRFMAIERTMFLIHVIEKGGKRGVFYFFNKPKKLSLYVDGKKYYNYKVASSNFYGSFPGKWLLDEAEYEKRKQKAIMDMLSDKSKPVNKFLVKARLHRDTLIRECIKEGWPRKRIEQVTTINPRSLHQIIHNE